MGRQQCQPQRLGRMLLQQILYPADVAQRLGHLGATEIEHAVVQPVTRKHLAVMGAGALRDLVFVMRKLQVDAAGMNVDGLAQVRFAHRRTFDRSEEHKSELQSLMRISYAVFCLKRKNMSHLELTTYF